MKSQIVTSSWGGLRRATPYAFTEQGIVMLSSVLRSKRAIQVNVDIMRTFVRLRNMLGSNAQLARKLKALEKKYDICNFQIVSNTSGSVYSLDIFEGNVVLLLSEFSIPHTLDSP